MFMAVIVPPDVTDCDDVSSPAVTMVRNSPVTATAIIAPIDIFRIAIMFPPIISNAKSQVLINVIVDWNYTTTLAKHANTIEKMPVNYGFGKLT